MAIASRISPVTIKKRKQLFIVGVASVFDDNNAETNPKEITINSENSHKPCSWRVVTNEFNSLTPSIPRP